MHSKIIMIAFWMSSSFVTFGQKGNLGIPVDTTITGFHYAADFDGISVYTKNGRSDLEKANPPSAFSFTFSNKLTFEDAKKEVLNLLARSYQDGYAITNRHEIDTTLNGKPGYIISYTETVEKHNYENLVFNAIIKKEDGILVFMSGDLDKGKYIQLFKTTFYKLIL